MSSVSPKSSDNARTQPVGVIGLGKMGGEIARHLVNQGWVVHGYDIRNEALEQLASIGGYPAASPATLAPSVDVVITSLPSSMALANVLSAADGLIAGAQHDWTLIDTSTMTSESKRAFRDQVASAGGAMLDCPLSGTARQMVDRDVAVYASGDSELLRTHWPILAAFSRAQYDVGEFGNGSDVKLLANLLVTVHNVAAAEVLVLAERAGLNIETVLAALCDGAGSSRMLQVRGPMMVTKDYSHVSATLAEFAKDIDLIAGFASAHDTALPLFKVCAAVYASALAAGFGAVDHAVVAEVVARAAVAPTSVGKD